MARLARWLGPIEAASDERSQPRSTDRGTAQTEAKCSERDGRGLGIERARAGRCRGVGCGVGDKSRDRCTQVVVMLVVCLRDTLVMLCHARSMHQFAYCLEYFDTVFFLRLPRGICCPSTTENVSLTRYLMAADAWHTCSTSF